MTKELSEQTGNILEQTGTLSKLMNEQGVLVVFASIIAILFIIIFLVVLFIMVKKVLPNSNVQVENAIKQVEELKNKIDINSTKLTEKVLPAVIQVYEQMLDYKEITVNQGMAINALQEAIMGFYVVLNEDKKLGIVEFKQIAPLRTSKTIYKIYKEICEIIDNNNIVQNIDLISDKINIIVTNTVEEGRAYLCGLNFDSSLLMKFTGGTDAMRENAIMMLQQAFIEAHEALDYLEQGIENIKKEHKERDTFSKKDFNNYIDNLFYKIDQQKQEYAKLKRRCWAVFENILNESSRFIRDLT
jgi:hypothetical protein